jgi:hypothetical protein
MILYKYLPPERVDVLERRRIRFTQPGDFNDPFEFRPCIQAVATDERLRAYVEENFDRIVEENTSEYASLTDPALRSVLKGIFLSQKDGFPKLFRLMEPQLIQKASTILENLFNQNVGVLCLSEIRNSILMWGHYTNNHQGFVVGFDSGHPFFLKRRSENDEFGFLRKVDYQMQRPQVIFSDTTATPWFETKSEEWAYEKEWRLVKVLSEASERVEREMFPICLFEFPADAVREIILGMRSPSSLVSRMEELAVVFPTARLFRASEDPREYRLVINDVRSP